MSNALLTACWPLRMPPTAKAVLIALADQANDRGECWPSIALIAERTCFGRTAVIDAVAWLEQHGVLLASRGNGRSTLYTITPKQPDQSACRTGLHAKRTNQSASATSPPAGQTSPPAGPDQSASRTTPVRLPDPNHQEPSRTTSKATIKGTTPAAAVLCPDGVDPQTWTDWLALRKAKKAPVTETVLRNARAEAEKAGLPLTRFLEIWCARGSQGLQADWLKPNERAGPGALGRRPSVSDSFAQTHYEGTPDDQLPDFLRPTGT